MSLMKIPAAAEQLGVSYKTIYNWISDSKLVMPKPGYVSIEEAEAVLIRQQIRRVEISFFLAQGTIRDAYGRFIQTEPKEGK